jgi:hypothetical protein
MESKQTANREKEKSMSKTHMQAEFPLPTDGSDKSLADHGAATERMREANGSTTLGNNARDGMMAADQHAAQSTLDKMGLGSFTIATESGGEQRQPVECFSGDKMSDLIRTRMSDATMITTFGLIGAAAAAGAVVGGPLGAITIGTGGLIAAGVVDGLGIPFAIGAAEGYIEGKIRNAYSGACSNTAR